MNWSQTLIRCSSIGSLMTDPKSKADKDAGELSKTAKTHLKAIYIKEKYGRDKDLKTRAIKKGLAVEEDSITILSRVQKKLLVKNEERLSNEFITGLPDIYEGESIRNADSITDIKSSYDLFTFIDNIGEPLDSNYYGQLQGYMALSGAKIAHIAYCLVNTPQSIIDGAKYALLKSMDVISEESPEFIAEALKIERNAIFDDIPKEERVLIFTVHYDPDYIGKLYDKVIKAREYLAELEHTHLNFNPKL